jgi:hypothetical protein
MDRSRHLDWETRSLSEASYAMRMSWMAGRVIQEVEGVACSPLGIFDIHIVLVYGEGPGAFKRLQEVIMSIDGHLDESLFAWERLHDSTLHCCRNQPPHIWELELSRWGLLAPLSDCFKTIGQHPCAQRAGSDKIWHRSFRIAHRHLLYSTL